MFGLFKAKPPLGPMEKAWTEYRMNWLVSHFGADRLLETPTLTPDYAGIPQVSNYEDALGLLDFLRTWMKIKAPKVRLQIYSDVISADSIAGPDDLENPTIIQVREKDLAHRDTLVAALSRGLAVEAIAEYGLSEELAADNGWTTELLPAYLGLGAFAANATVEENSYSDGTYSSWSMARRGELPSRVFGYAMALRSFVRGDEETSWSGLLRQDAKSAFEGGMKYLAKSDDSTFHRDGLGQPAAANSLVDDLENGTPSRQINALWELSKRVGAEEFEPDAETGQRVVEITGHRNVDVRATAIRALPHFERSQQAVHEICDALMDPNSGVRSEAAHAAGSLVGFDDEPLVDSLTAVLKDESRGVAYNAADSLCHFGEAAEAATNGLIKCLHKAFVDCKDDEGLLFARALLVVTPSTSSDVRSLFDDAESEFRGYACGIIDQLTGDPDDL